MKSTIRKRTYQAIYRLLNKVSPINGDCGKLCGAACCTVEDPGGTSPDDWNLGIYLLPGEEKLFTGKEPWLTWNFENVEDYEFPYSWHGKVYFIKCKAAPSCDRKMRPLQCRFFPLAPHITKKGVFKLILCHSDLPYSCPLINEKHELAPSFIKATHTVWKRLIKDPLIYDLVQMDSSFREDSELTYLI